MKAKTFIKLLSAIFVLCIAFAIIPACGNGEDGSDSSSSNKIEVTPDQYFKFVEQEDGTYAIGAKYNKDDPLPANVVLPKRYNGEKITAILEEGFSNCKNLRSIVIQEGVKEIRYHAFWFCPLLRSITLPKTLEKINEIAFSGCYSLLEIVNKSPAFNFSKEGNEYLSFTNSALVIFNRGDRYENRFSTDEKGLVTYRDGKDVILVGYDGEDADVIIPSNVTSINGSAFLLNNVLKNIKFEEDSRLTKIEPYAFQFFPSAESIILPQSLTAIHLEAFGGSSFESIILPDGITRIEDRAFNNCSSLKSIVIPSGVTTIGDEAFQGCGALTEIEIPDKITSIGKCTFQACAGLSSIIIPNSVVSIGEHAFSHCIKLTSVVLGASVNSIGYDAFYNCYKLLEVINKSSHITVEKGNASNGWIGYYATSVSNCDDSYVSKITNDNGHIIYTEGNKKILVTYIGNEADLVIPSNITRIYKSAFKSYFTLTSVVIPNSVTYIENEAFSNCVNLSKIYYMGTILEWKNINIGFDNSQLGVATRYYYSETQPNEEGNFWHYDENGNVVIW